MFCLHQQTQANTYFVSGHTIQDIVGWSEIYFTIVIVEIKFGSG